MIRTQISFDGPLYAKARRLARKQGISLAELCRRGLEELLGREAANGKSWMAYAGALSSGDRNASESVDAVVYGRQEP